MATGLLAGWNMANFLTHRDLLVLPPTTILGSLCHYVTQANLSDFQPMKANFGLLPPLTTKDNKKSSRKMRKRERAQAYAERALADLEAYLGEVTCK